MSTTTDKPSVFGRDRALLTRMVKVVHRELSVRYRHTDPIDTRRGSTFELLVDGDNPQDAARRYRVTVELVEVVTP